MREGNKSYYHICNPSTPEPSGCKNIVSKKALQEVKDDSNAVYLLHIHLNWEGNKLSSNYGFDIANLIRTEKKSKAPIIFYSAIQQEYFEKKSEKKIKYKILFGRGSAFIEAPFKEAELNKLAENIEPLSKAALHDVVTMLCNLKGIVIDKLNHDLKFDADIDKVIASVSPYLSSLQKSEIKLESYVAKLKGSVEENKPTLFNEVKQSFILLCNSKLTEQGNKEPQGERTKHKILLIDDLPSEIEKAENFLNSDFIVETATTGEQAIKILKDDVKNEIVAVVSDWRLFTDAKQNYWQPLQGYEVLDFAANNGIRSLFALTSQADFVVHHLRNLMGIRFSMFKKENLNTADQWKVFTDVLFEACVETVNSKASILSDFPTWTKSWERKKINQPTLKEQYIELWNSIDRDSILNQMELTLEEMWEYLLNDKDPYLVTEKRFVDFGISHKVLDLKKILVLRRIWFGLWLHFMPSGKMGAESLKRHSESVYTKMFGLPSDGGIAQRTFNLCIHLDKIKKDYMLPEEIDWLTRKGMME